MDSTTSPGTLLRGFRRRFPPFLKGPHLSFEPPQERPRLRALWCRRDPDKGSPPTLFVMHHDKHLFCSFRLGPFWTLPRPAHVPGVFDRVEEFVRVKHPRSAV